MLLTGHRGRGHIVAASRTACCVCTQEDSIEDFSLKLKRKVYTLVVERAV